MNFKELKKMDTLIDLCRKHIENNRPQKEKNELAISMINEALKYGNKKQVHDKLQHFRMTNILTDTQKQFVKIALMELDRYE